MYMRAGTWAATHKSIIARPKVTPTTTRSLEVGRQQHLVPLPGLVDDELAEIGGRAGQHRAGGKRQPRFEGRIGDAGVDPPGHPAGDVSGAVLRGAQAATEPGPSDSHSGA